METFKINGVEIFSAGTWNGDMYTVSDLQTMVEAFDKTKEGIRPFLKLGHDDDQKILQKDGLPAAGWVDRVYIMGEKLFADFTDIPKSIYDLIKAKAYRKVSCEIFYNLTLGDNKYQYLLGAVALLGADTPGVMNLKDILAQYKNRKAEAVRIYDALNLEVKDEHTTRKDIKMSKTENEIKLEIELKAKEDEVQSQTAQLKELQEKESGLQKQLEEALKFKAEAEKKEQESLAKAKAAELEKYITELKADKLISPAMEANVRELLGEDKKEYTIKFDKEEKKFSKQELFKETLKLSKSLSDVNFEESSLDDKGKDMNSAEELDKKANEYAAKNNVSYGAALRVVRRENKK